MDMEIYPIPHVYGGGLSDTSDDNTHYALSCTECHSVHTNTDTVSTALDYCYDCHHKFKFACGICHSIPADY
jgi:hypothetical protein